MFLGPGGLEDFAAGLQIADRGMERNCGGLHFGAGIHGLGRFGARLARTGIGRRCRFACFVDLAVALDELLLQHLQLLLLRLQCLAELFELCRDGCIGVLGLRRLSLGRLRIGVFP